jgi:hypothetical protein
LFRKDEVLEYTGSTSSFHPKPISITGENSETLQLSSKERTNIQAVTLFDESGEILSINCINCNTAAPYTTYSN